MHNFDPVDAIGKTAKRPPVGIGASGNAAFLSFNPEDNDPLKKNPAYIGGLLNGSIPTNHA